MNLIAYSDSEGSGDEAPPVPRPAAKPATKPTFQKVVDRSNPGKIKLNLPGTSKPEADKDHLDSEAPPAKRARLGAGGGVFSGFNAMLPAPKKPKIEPTAGVPSSSGKKVFGKGLGAGVNLRTGAEPAFRREPGVDTEEYDENGNPVKREPMDAAGFRAMLNLPPPKSEKNAARNNGPNLSPSTEPTTTTNPRVDVATPPASQVKPVAARPKFVPMSMARCKKKLPTKPRIAPREEPSKSTSDAASSTSPHTSQSPTTDPKPPAKPKVSLFSIPTQEESVAKTSAHDTTPYQPLLYGTEAADEEDAPIPDSAFESSFQSPNPHPQQYQDQQPTSNPLTDIATELNLSASERRQLFGRHAASSSATPSHLVEFNTDAEYAHNERLRQQGETVQHNALKPISGSGKNSLRSLINVATTQKEALEDHFAAGRRNKREAGNRYGW